MRIDGWHAMGDDGTDYCSFCMTELRGTGAHGGGGGGPDGDQFSRCRLRVERNERDKKAKETRSKLQ